MRWVEIRENIPLSDRMLFVVGTWLLNFIIFWSYNSILLLSYRLQLFKRFQIQPNSKPPEELVWQNMKETVLGQFTALPIIIYLLYDVFIYFGMSINTPTPETKIIFRDLLVALICVDTFGYWGHRLLHHPAIYKYVHKHHHQYKVNVGIASVFAHPFEDISTNTFSTISGCLFMGSHIVVLWLWLAIRLIEAVSSHSGYHFLPYWISDPFSSGEFHEFHHSHNVGNYGAFTTYWDKLMGTDVAYKEYLRKKTKVTDKANSDKKSK
jgi:sterol desaturase/sphingolipid hydroxylase (fatty acid hydroxylase superfamily)